MAKLSDLTEAEWDTLKKNANIPNTSVFKTLLGGAANVGNAIKAYHKARDTWKTFKAKPTTDVVKNYVTALDNLDKAFATFKKIKEFNSEEAKALKTAIDGWQTECKAKVVKLNKVLANKAELKKNEAEYLIKALKETGMY